MSDNRFTIGSVALGLALTGATGACLYLLLRKEEEYEYGGESGSVTSRQVVLDVKIPKESVGVVIGRQGSNIREIQAKTETRINFRDELETDEWRVASIRGLPDAAQMAEILIHQTIAAQPRVETLTMMVPVRAVGRIIGRNGDTVRSIQQVSKCKVDVERGDNKGAVEKKIVLKGTSDTIATAREIIENKVKEEEMMWQGSGQRISRKQPLNLFYDQHKDEEERSRKGEQEELKSTGSDDLVEVFVSVISTPSSFWVQKVGPSSVDLDKLTQDMTEYYSKESHQKYHSLTSVYEGELVACKFSADLNYYRARVVAFKDNTVDLDFVDFGGFEEKLIGDVFEIKKDFLELKFQAIQCSMAHIWPVSDSEWSGEACDVFESLTHCAMWKVVWARVVECTPRDGGKFMPCVELIDTNMAGGDMNVGVELVRQGLAVDQKQEDANVKEKIDDQEDREDEEDTKIKEYIKENEDTEDKQTIINQFREN